MELRNANNEVLWKKTLTGHITEIHGILFADEGYILYGSRHDSEDKTTAIMIKLTDEGEEVLRVEMPVENWPANSDAVIIADGNILLRGIEVKSTRKNG